MTCVTWPCSTREGTIECASMKQLSVHPSYAQVQSNLSVSNLHKRLPDAVMKLLSQPCFYTQGVPHFWCRRSAQCTLMRDVP